MALSDAVAAIRTRAESLWPALEATVPLSWPNENPDPPLPRVDANGTPLPFVVVELRWNGGEFGSIGSPGSNLARRQGHIWIFAYVARGSGESRAHELAAKAASMFEGEDFSGVVCEAMEPGGEADTEDGNLFGQSAAIPFDYDETA